MKNTIVSYANLRSVLVALNGPPHLIAELMATRNALISDNPIDALIKEFNEWVEKANDETSKAPEVEIPEFLVHHDASNSYIVCKSKQDLEKTLDNNLECLDVSGSEFHSINYVISKANPNLDPKSVIAISVLRWMTVCSMLGGEENKWEQLPVARKINLVCETMRDLENMS